MTRTELEQVFWMQKEIEQREEQLAILIQQSQVKSPQITGMPFQNTGDISDKVADTAVRIIEYTEQISAYKEALEIRKQAIDRWIMELPDSYLRQIVHYRCYDLLGWANIAVLLNTTEGSVKMYYNRSIPKGGSDDNSRNT